MNNRIEKVNSLLQREISKILLHDFSFSPEILITITMVKTSSNLIEAKVYISVYPDTKFDEILKALQKSVYDIQHKINRTFKMRPVPKIIFVKDQVSAKAGRVEELLAELKNNEK